MSSVQTSQLNTKRIERTKTFPIATNVVTLKDLQRLVQSSQSQGGQSQSRALGIKLYNKPFWYWDHSQT